MKQQASNFERLSKHFAKLAIRYLYKAESYQRNSARAALKAHFLSKGSK